MLTSLTAGDWLRLIAALLLFVGPGAALLSLYTGRQAYPVAWQVNFAILFAVAAWPVVMAWLQLLNLSLSRPALVAFFAISWLIAAIRLWPRIRPMPRLRRPAAMPWFPVIVAVGGSCAQSVVVGPGR
jgi:hypothetical protein